MESELTGIDDWLKHSTPTDEDRAVLKRLFLAASKGKHAIEADACPKTPLPVVHQEGKLYFKRLFDLEKKAFSLFTKKLNETPEITFNKPDLKGLGLLPEQEEGITSALDHPLFFLTGGPGTGKTHTAGLLIKTMKQQKPNLLIGIAAPTGKAVSQLKKSLLKHLKEEDFEAKTLHSMLETYKDESPILPYDLLLVDEGSMIDLEIMTRLFSAARPLSRLILMGDPWQLPPVEAGALFKTFVDKAPGTKLSKCLRTDLLAIVELAELIKNEESGKVIHFLKEGHPGIHFTPHTDLSFPLTEKIILTPLRKGPLGSEALNKKALSQAKTAPYPIMITRNHNELMLYNGDMGTLSSLHIEPGVKARFNELDIPAILLPSWEYAWALSIHKSQGSEFDHLRIILPQEAEDLTPALLYTAVTRAKKSCHIHASEETLIKVFSDKK